MEQLFLIHAETGLLLLHVPGDTEPRNAQLVAAMLSAIRDFVKDSFTPGSEAPDSLESLQVGELAVMMVQGPHAVLAAVVRGHLPAEGRAIFRDALAAVHREHGPELRAFDGDGAPFQRSRQILERCLISKFRQSGL